MLGPRTRGLEARLVRTVLAPLALLCLLVSASSAAAAELPGGYHYLDAAQLDLVDLLPPPPDTNSPEALADENKVAKIVAQRTPAQMEEAKDESKRTVFFFQPSVGPSFSPDALPKTAAFFERAESDVERLVDVAKGYWQRPRPPFAPEKHGSYPSGHAAFAASAAIMLSMMLPEKRGAIFTQARLFAENRIILGVHYPTDIAAGWTTGTLAVSVMMRNKKYKADFLAAEVELRKQMGYMK